MKYHHGLMQMILHDKAHIAKAHIAKAHIAKAVKRHGDSLDDAPRGYKDFDSGVAKKFVFNPHGSITT